MTETLTHTPSVKRLERSSGDKWIAGVCGGLGRYFDLNPAVFRLGLVVLTLLGGAGVLVYLAAVLIIPGENKERSIAEDVLADRRDHPGRLVVLGLVAVAVFVTLSQAHTWPTAGAAWILVIFAGLYILFASKERRAHRILIGAVSTLVLLLVTAAVAVVTAFAWFDVSLSDGVGDRVYTPASASDVHDRYELGIGNLKVDLSQIPAGADLHVKAHLGIGELRVIVPHDASIVVSSHAKAGEIYALDRHDDGRNARVRLNGGGTLDIDAQVGAGRIDVERAG